MWFDAISIRVARVIVGDATLLVGRGGGEQERMSLRESCFLLRWHRYRRNSEAKQTDNSRNAFSEARSFKGLTLAAHARALFVSSVSDPYKLPKTSAKLVRNAVLCDSIARF